MDQEINLKRDKDWEFPLDRLKETVKPIDRKKMTALLFGSFGSIARHCRTGSQTKRI